nr:leucine-rich repeat-containing protein 52-like [Anolis sagrei ordinatus]
MGTPILPTFSCSPVLSLVFLLAMQWAGTAYGCPKNCTCEPWAMNCTNQGLRDLPEGIPPVTRHLILRKNHITTLPILEMTYLNELVYLDCSHNWITMNEMYQFPFVEKLSYLDLSYNRIAHLNSKTFSRVTMLLLLNLSNNPTMQVINPHSFDHNRLLRYVDMSSCNLTQLSAELFRDQYNLHSLGLRNNPFNCDCNLLEFINWLLKPKVNWEVIDPENTACNEPGLLKFVPILQAEEYLHEQCLQETILVDHGRTALYTFGFFVGGTLAAWILGVVSVIFYHPIFKREDDLDEEREYIGI